MVVLEIDDYDLSPWLAAGGIEYSSNDLDSKGSGRSPMTATMFRHVIGSKVKLEITCIPVPETVSRAVLPIIKRPYVRVKYRDPEYGETVKVFYSNNRKCRLEQVYINGSELWAGLSFPLIER